jgi:hypothetical protein
MWPFTKKPEPPDSTPPSAAAKAIVESLTNEPERWKVQSSGSQVRHDSGVTVTTYGYCIRPDLARTPDADIYLIRDALCKWCAITVSMPKPADAPEPTPGATR